MLATIRIELFQWNENMGWVPCRSQTFDVPEQKASLYSDEIFRIALKLSNRMQGNENLYQAPRTNYAE